MRFITYGTEDNEMHLSVEPNDQLVRIEFDTTKPLLLKPEEVRKMASDLKELAEVAQSNQKKD